MMSRGIRAAGLAARLLAVWLASAAPAASQAFTPPDGVGSVTLASQYIHNLGHRFTDGSYQPNGDSVTTSVLLDAEYAFSDRLSATLGLPYVFAKYTGSIEPFSGLPHDTCRCWNSGFADFGASVRYRFGGATWAVTPIVRLGVPSHDYVYRGEAVVGKALTEAQLGVLAGLRLVDLLPSATVQAGYTYAFVERPIDDVPVDRSNLFVDFGYAVNRWLYVRGAWTWQHTHGGLRLGSPITGEPFPAPGEADTPERIREIDRLLHTRLMQLGGGLSVNLGPVDVFASYTKYIWGRDAHNSRVFGLGATWYFGLPN
jgi:hypothetical protein